MGSSNFTYPGLTTNAELNLTHKVLFETEELDDAEAADTVAWLTSEPSAPGPASNRPGRIQGCGPGAGPG